MRAFLAGAGIAYFFDPQQGKRRRHVLRDRAAKLGRRAARVTAKKSRFVLGHLQGLVARSRQVVARPQVATDDRTVEQRIRSDVFRDAGISGRDVELEVEQGIVTLVGAVPSRAVADNVVARVRKVPGVRDVSDLLRVAGQQAVAAL
ncbi:MAG TPA: BON domain-containing protein [Gaiellaceae bacterium]|nr:BON domain-containing protein [Gaiellaceae bacterium]